jgi:hypothetical protein
MKLLLIILLAFLVSGCGKYEELVEMGDLKLTSPAFENNNTIPEKYTCDGDNVNPQLIIQGVPSEAKTLVLIVDDPDAGAWVHWILFNIPANVANIDEDSVPSGAVQAMNSFNKNSYGGPCPPSGTHRYIFKLYALDNELGLDENSEKPDIEKAMQGHIVAQTKLAGLYAR